MSNNKITLASIAADFAAKAQSETVKPASDGKSEYISSSLKLVLKDEKGEFLIGLNIFAKADETGRLLVQEVRALRALKALGVKVMEKLPEAVADISAVASEKAALLAE